MAELDPEIRPSQDGNFLSYSRGQLPNTSVAGLFEDSRMMLGAGVTAINNQIVENIRRDVTESADAIRDRFTGRTPFDSTTNPADSGVTGTHAQTPEELVNYGTRLQALTQAYRSGRLQESHYWTLLDVEARRIRQRYPGHRREVDTIMQEVVGTNPANALVRELREEATRRATTEQNQHEYWLRQATELGTPLGINYQELVRQGRPPTTLDLQSEVANRRRRLAAANDERTAAERELSLGRRDTQRAVRSAQTELYGEVNQVLEVGRARIQDYERRIQELRTRQGTINPRELEEARVMFESQILEPLRGVFRRVMHAPRPGQAAGTTWATLIGDPQEVQRIETTFNQMLTMMGGAVSSNTQDGWTLFSRIDSMLRVYQRGDQVRLFQDPVYGGTFRNLAAVREILGPQFAASAYIRELPNVDRALQEIFRQGHEDDIVNGRTITERTVRDRTAVPADQRGTMLNTRIQALVGDLSNPEMNERAIVANARVLFGPGNESFLATHTRNPSEVYRMIMADGRLHANMLRIRASNPDLYKSYQEWVVNGFGVSLRRIAADVRDMTIGGVGSLGDDAHIVFDVSTNQFRFNGPAGQYQSQRQAIENINAAVLGFSQFLQNQEPRLNPEQVRTALAARLGALFNEIDPSSSTPGGVTNRTPNRGFWGRLYDSMRMFNSSARISPTPGMEGYIPPPVGPLSPTGGNREHYAELLNLIGRGEGGSGGYGAVFGSRTPRSDLTTMTLSQIQELQENMLSEGLESTAVGRYQFIRQTLDEAITGLGLDPNTTQFTPAIQDRLAIWLLENRRGMRDFLRNPNATGARERMVDQLSREWAAVPRPSTGRSRYEGIGSNRATISRADLDRVLDDLVSRYGAR